MNAYRPTPSRDEVALAIAEEALVRLVRIAEAAVVDGTPVHPTDILVTAGCAFIQLERLRR